MRSNTLKALALVAALMLVTVVASGFRGGADRTALPKGTIAVGFGNNLTGFLAVHDHLISQGAQLAIRQINAGGGIGGRVKIVLRLKDVKSDPATGVEVANEIIGEKDTAMILPCPSDFSAFVGKITAAKPQAVMTGLFTPYVDTLTKQLRSAGSTVPVLGSDGMDTGLDLSAGGTSVNGNVFTTFGFPSPGSATAKF